MAKGPRITDEVKWLIAKIYLEHPDWRAKEVRMEVNTRLCKKNPKLNPDWPGLSTVQKELTEIRKKYAARPPEATKLDEPWSLGSLVEYPIAPEAILRVVSIYEKCLLEAASEDWLLSIREALWIGRLHKIIELYQPEHILPDVRDAIQEAIISGRELPIELKGGNPTNQELASAWGLKGKEIPFEDLVLEWAYTYSQYEIISEIEGKPFGSRELDIYIMANVYEFYGDRRNDFIEQIAEKYDVDEDKLVALNLSIGDIERAAMSGKYQKEAKNERSHNQEVQE